MKVKLDEAYIGHKTDEVPLGPGTVEVGEELGEYLVTHFVWAHRVARRPRARKAKADDERKGKAGTA